MVVNPASFIAIDWGTTNRRVYLIEHGRVIRSERDDRGVSAMVPDSYGAEIHAIRDRFGNLSILCAGMIGSTVGWRTAPYVPAPAACQDLANALLDVGDAVSIVPGVMTTEPAHADVMRGEEVQILGAALAGLVPPDALVCQPGTHCKWARLSGGRLAGFTTAMTGELFALLRTHSLIAPQLQGSIEPDASFLQGVAEARRRDLAASLFGIRTASVLGLRGDAEAAAYASGLLIGSDVAARLTEHDDAQIHILGDEALAALYATAIRAWGRNAQTIDSHAAFVAGIVAIQGLRP